MARHFDNTDDGLYRANVGVSSFPCTLSCWHNPDDFGQFNMLVHLNQGTVGDDDRSLGIRCQSSTGYCLARWHDSSNNNVTAETTNGASAGSWSHFCGTFSESGGNVTANAWLDAGTKATGTGTASDELNTLDATQIGFRDQPSGTDYYCDGKIAEVGIWDVELTEAEVGILAKGYSPLCVRPESLIRYWPLIGRTDPEIELMGGQTLTLQSAPSVTWHPRVIYPSAVGWSPPSAGAAPAATPYTSQLLTGVGA